MQELHNTQVNNKRKHTNSPQQHRFDLEKGEWTDLEIDDGEHKPPGLVNSAMVYLDTDAVFIGGDSRDGDCADSMWELYIYVNPLRVLLLYLVAGGVLFLCLGCTVGGCLWYASDKVRRSRVSPEGEDDSDNGGRTNAFAMVDELEAGPRPPALVVELEVFESDSGESSPPRIVGSSAPDQGGEGVPSGPASPGSGSASGGRGGGRNGLGQDKIQEEAAKQLASAVSRQKSIERNDSGKAA